MKFTDGKHFFFPVPVFCSIGSGHESAVVSTDWDKLG